MATLKPTRRSRGAAARLEFCVRYIVIRQAHDVDEVVSMLAPITPWPKLRTKLSRLSRNQTELDCLKHSSMQTA